MGVLDNLIGNVNIKDTVESLTKNTDLMNKISSLKDDKEIQNLVSSATEAFKDHKLSDEEKKELTDKLKSAASNLNLFGKK